MKQPSKSFTITSHKGFYLKFDNGVTLSTQFGYGNYCENYDTKNFLETDFLGCDDCEIGIWKSNGDWITQEIIPDAGDDVKGRVTISQWLEIVNACKNWKE